MAAASSRALYRVRPRHLVVATGAIEQPVVFPNNDLPGVMLSSAVELLVRRFGVLPGQDGGRADLERGRPRDGPNPGRGRGGGVGGRPA